MHERAKSLCPSTLQAGPLALPIAIAQRCYGYDYAPDCPDEAGVGDFWQRDTLTDAELGPWLGQRLSGSPGDGGMVGHCGVTPETPSTAADCRSASAGSWPLKQIGVRSLDECAAYCKAHCPRCRFVSFSTHLWHRDCSWYSACPQLELNNLGKTYRTRLVRPETQPPPGGELRGSAPAPSVV